MCLMKGIRKGIKRHFFIAGILLFLGFGSPIESNPASVENLLLEAKTLETKGDLDGARRSYQAVLQQESHNEAARKGLTEVLIKSQIEDPYADESDALSHFHDEREPVLSK